MRFEPGPDPAWQSLETRKGKQMAPKFVEYTAQQGDVCFHKVDGLPEDLKPVVPKYPGKATFAEGEVTGHHHSAVIEPCRTGEGDNVEVYTDSSGQMWCRVREDVDVVHQEHKTVHLTPGDYKVHGVQEYDPMAEEVRRVAD